MNIFGKLHISGRHKKEIFKLRKGERYEHVWIKKFEMFAYWNTLGIQIRIKEIIAFKEYLRPSISGWFIKNRMIIRKGKLPK